MKKELEALLRSNRDWADSITCEDPTFFERLSKQQAPKYLWIGCSDSRVPSNQILGMDPGQVFVHRNIANVIPVTDLNVLAVVNYAIEHIGVKHIVVCGHYGCGGIKTAMTSSDAGVLNPWLGHIRDVYRLHKGELNAIESPEARHDRLVELNVLEQCINLVKIRDVQKALLKKKLRIHGWAFDMKTGRLNDLHFQANRIAREVIDIYNVL